VVSLKVILSHRQWAELKIENADLIPFFFRYMVSNHFTVTVQ
jgi:hypothetical protein